LYFATLATHYVEYHVLMFPRCFNSQLDDNNSLDRWFGGLRGHRAVFYGATLLVAGIVMAFRTLGRSPSMPISYLVWQWFPSSMDFSYFTTSSRC